MTTYPKITIYFSIWLFIFHLGAPVSFAAPPSTEYAVKAAFLYQFTKFVEWPPEAFDHTSDVFIVGIIGKDPFKDKISFLKGKEANERTVDVRYIDDLKDIRECRILFIADSEKARLGRITQMAEQSHVLTVSDTEGFADEGVMINLVEMSNKIGFEINRSSVHRAGIKISSHLLKLAKIVGPEVSNQ